MPLTASALKDTRRTQRARWTGAWALVLLTGCASAPEPQAPTPIRGRAPIGYQKTISDYFAFRMPTPQTNVEISYGKPEPGGCPLGLGRSSERGWVVPVVYATRSGTPTGRESINITGREYYFWFVTDTIAGVTQRMELCP
ncbi:MAG TPA: hypothetical protein VHM00_03560 [Caldimonas sp.]|jgi:hypothetical protein|nr:hypothetical protein [Caldimonas sp.]HEX2540141.1 hypothetical protein [Caldimonas sp.]